MNQRSTVSAVCKSDYKFWRSMLAEQQITPNQFEKVQSNMNYFRTIANTVNFDAINAQPFLMLFPNNFWEYEKNDINKIVFESITELKTQQRQSTNPDAQFDLMQKLISLDPDSFMAKSDLKRMKADIEVLDRDAEGRRRRATGAYNEFQRHLQKANEYESEADKLRERIAELEKGDGQVDQQLTDMIQQVINDGDFVYLGSSAKTIKRILLRVPHVYEQETIDFSDRNKVHDSLSYSGHFFLSSTPLVCQYVNTSANVSMRLDFGYWLVVLSDEGYVNFCRPIINYMGNSNTFHPHFSYDGICWGSSGYRYDRLTGKNRNFLGILKLLKSLVETYNPDNPYVKLRNLYKYKNTRWVSGLPLELQANLPMEIFPQDLRELLEEDSRNLLESEKNSSDFTERYKNWMDDIELDVTQVAVNGEPSADIPF